MLYLLLIFMIFIYYVTANRIYRIIMYLLHYVLSSPCDVTISTDVRRVHLIGTEKSPETGFPIFSSLDCRFSFIFHSEFIVF